MSDPAHAATPDHLAGLLRAHARGLYPNEAAAELLIRHDTWLRRGDVRRHVGTAPTVDAAVVWDNAVAALEAGRLPCSTGEAQMPHLAASLGAGVPVDLRDAVVGLSHTNVGYVAAAICHAGRGDRTAGPQGGRAR